MSWNFTVGPCPLARFAAEAERAATVLGGAEREQADRAVAAALLIVESGVAGDAGVRVVFAGHANPGHTGLADGGTADPHVTVAVAYVPLSMIPADTEPSPVDLAPPSGSEPGTATVDPASPIPGTAEQLPDGFDLNTVHAADTPAGPTPGTETG